MRGSGVTGVMISRTGRRCPKLREMFAGCVALADAGRTPTMAGESGRAWPHLHRETLLECCASYLHHAR